jgi:hypothetical protein
MASLFPDATVHPPVSPEWQYCCILKNGGGLSQATGSGRPEKESDESET